MHIRFSSLFLVGLLLAAFGGRAGETATAADRPAVELRSEEQSRPIRPQRSTERSRSTTTNRSTEVGAVPDWAETAPQSSPGLSSSERHATTKVANFPDNPNKVPLGIPPSVLALVGIGYAVGRLRETH